MPGLFSVPRALEPLDAALEDVRHVRERLDVVHRRRHAEGAVLRRERRLLARLALLAFERLEQAGLFAADVGAGAAVHDDVVLEALLAEACSCRGSPSRTAPATAARARGSARAYSPRT